MSIKIKKKYVDGKIVWGAINDNMDEVIPFIYDEIKPIGSFSSFYICSKDGVDELYYNGRMLIDFNQGLKFGEYLCHSGIGAEGIIITAFKDEKIGIIGVGSYYKKNNFDVLCDFGKLDSIHKTSDTSYSFGGLTTIEIADKRAYLYKSRNVGNHKVREIGYLTNDCIIIDPCYNPEFINCDYNDDDHKKIGKIELLKGYRYSEEEGRYLAFLAQKRDNRYEDILSNVEGDIFVVGTCWGDTPYFNGRIIVKPFNSKQKNYIYGFCLDKETMKLKQAFKYGYNFSYSNVSKKTCTPTFESNNIKVIKNSKVGVVRLRTSAFQGHNKPIKEKDYIVDEAIPAKYDEITFISNNYAIGKIGEYYELIIMENEGKYMTKKSTKVFANNYVSISKKDCFFECVKQDGKKDIIWCSSNVQSKLDGHSYAFDEINFVAAEDVDSAETMAYKNDVAIIKTTKNGKVQVEDLHFDEDFTTYYKKGTNPNSIVDASFNKNSGTYTLFFNDGTLMVYREYTSSKPILTLNDSTLTAENSYIEYISEINMVAIKKDNQIRLYKHDLNEFCLESLLDRNFLDIKYLSYNTLIYTELIDNELYTTISSVHHESTIDYRGFRVKPSEYVHIKDSFVVESSINNCGSIAYLIVSKIDPNTKQKLYGVLHLQSRKIIIGYEFTNINVIEKPCRDNTIIKFECTTPDGTVLKYDSDGFIEMDEPGFTRNRVQN